ncbi:unnamed protein product [Trypanosoma congolense IL3000]|uniref:WGS project CAEQ00000000 data, annotated contig 1871 n=1 Tax=Trypanosoma congolense (strain IL3000) TaxID=1068625 RepID=F9W9K5_TRYCI|nr:unnamed protein product [Trypanosoma congolense IL3000]
MIAVQITFPSLPFFFLIFYMQRKEKKENFIAHFFFFSSLLFLVCPFFVFFSLFSFVTFPTHAAQHSEKYKKNYFAFPPPPHTQNTPQRLHRCTMESATRPARTRARTLNGGFFFSFKKRRRRKKKRRCDLAPNGKGKANKQKKLGHQAYWRLVVN